MTAPSIPGTHNSGCIGGPLGLAKTQNLDLPDQLLAGTRFFDIRLTRSQDDLFVHHNVVRMGTSHRDVLDIFADFLRRHPSEAPLVSVEEAPNRVTSPVRTTDDGECGASGCTE